MKKQSNPDAEADRNVALYLEILRKYQAVERVYGTLTPQAQKMRRGVERSLAYYRRIKAEAAR